MTDTRDGGVIPRVVDNDRDEITLTLDGKELRGWSYKDETERRVKMLCAREFVEGWFQASKRCSALVKAANAIMAAETVTVHVGYDSGSGGGNFVYADAVRTDSEAFENLRAALSRTKENG